MAKISLQQAQERVSELRKQLNKWADAYYAKDAPVVEDNVYDKSYNELVQLENDFSELKSADSITQRVGGEIKSDFSKVEHPIPMLSMGDVFSKEELKEFDKRIQKAVGHPVAYNVELKIDYNQNCKPSKANPEKKIDSIISMCTALGGYEKEG